MIKKIDLKEFILTDFHIVYEYSAWKSSKVVTKEIVIQAINRQHAKSIFKVWKKQQKTSLDIDILDIKESNFNIHKFVAINQTL